MARPSRNPLGYEPISAADSLSLSLPSLEINPEGYRIPKASLSSYRTWNGHLESWDSFAEDVRIALRRTPPSAMALTDVSIHDRDLERNRKLHTYWIAEEKGVESGFVSNALIPVSKAARFPNRGISFGDFKGARVWPNGYNPQAPPPSSAEPVSRRPQDIPDFALMSDHGRELRACGEAKTDWRDRMALVFQHPWPSSTSDSVTRIVRSPESARLQWAGAVGKYLRDNNLKYGFVTTYSSTIFLKLSHKGLNESDDILSVSLPVSYSTHADGQQVSVRQGLWFLIHTSLNEEWRAPERKHATVRGVNAQNWQTSLSARTKDAPRTRSQDPSPGIYRNPVASQITNLEQVRLEADGGKLYFRSRRGKQRVPFQDLRFFPDIGEIAIEQNGKLVLRVVTDHKLWADLFAQAEEPCPPLDRSITPPTPEFTPRSFGENLTDVRRLKAVELKTNGGNKLYYRSNRGKQAVPFRDLRFFPHIGEIAIEHNGQLLHRVKADRELEQNLFAQAGESYPQDFSCPAELSQGMANLNLG